MPDSKGHDYKNPSCNICWNKRKYFHIFRQCCQPHLPGLWQGKRRAMYAHKTSLVPLCFDLFTGCIWNIISMYIFWCVSVSVRHRNRNNRIYRCIRDFLWELVLVITKAGKTHAVYRLENKRSAGVILSKCKGLRTGRGPAKGVLV